MEFYEQAVRGFMLFSAWWRTRIFPKSYRRIFLAGLKVSEKLDDLEGLLTENRIFKQRNVDIGVVSKKDAIELGFRELCLGDLGSHGT